MVETITTVYVVYVEPILCLGYIWLLWRTKRSLIKELHSSFYTFFFLSGVAACLNVMMTVAKRTSDRFVPGMELRTSLQDYLFNLIIFFSHSFSLSHTIGKALMVVTRFSAIAYPLSGDFWTSFHIKVATILMFVLPTMIYAFMIPLEAFYRLDNRGLLIYIGVELWAQKLSKLFSASASIIFIVVSVPLCAASMYHLRLAQRFNKTLARQERALLYYTIAITIAHLVKSAHQILWYITMVLDDPGMFDLVTNTYSIGNTLTTFVPPLLLMATSSLVRNQVTFGCCGRLPRRNSVAPKDFSPSGNSSSQDVA